MLNELKNIGLSDKEARVYLAMLELGAATVLEIAAKAGINRPTAYVEIEALKKKGLASSQTKGTKKLFIAESPSQLEFVLDREAKEVDAKKSELAKILPELSTLFNLADEKPQVRFFEGVEGLLSIQHEFLKSKSKVIESISSLDDLLKVFPQHHDEYSPERQRRKILGRVIYTSSSGSVMKERDRELYRESKYVSPDDFKFTSDISIFDDKVAISSLKGKVFGLIIENQNIADSVRALFYLTWHKIQ